MDKHAAVAALIPALFLYACDRASSPPGPGPVTSSDIAQPVASPQISGEPASLPSPPLGYTDGSGINEGYPNLAPVPLSPEAERTEKGATNVLMAFARSIELKEFDQAWILLSEADKRKWTKGQFTQVFADLDEISVAFAGGSMEGAAGTSYYSAPLSITASDTNGRPVRIEGKATLRRSNDVPGASPAQLRWHFDSVTLNWTH